MPAPGALVGFIPVTDTARSRAFYMDMLGLAFVHDDAFALVLRSSANEGEAGNLIRVVRMKTVTPAPYTILGWETSAIDADVKRLTVAGVTFTRFGHFQQDEFGIWTAPDGSKVAWFTDPDGNVLSLSQH